MRRTTVFLEEAVDRDLKAIARAKNVPAAAILREALASYLKSEKKKLSRLSIVAMGRSGRTDVAETHEDALWAGLEPHGPRGKEKGAGPRNKLRGRRE
ncbi:MAG: hypothetical protein HY721_30025 [Planctomycetes bacterium]|nr:hypothetical protein [Planctomycetota bacterium]